MNHGYFAGKFGDKLCFFNSRISASDNGNVLIYKVFGIARGAVGYSFSFQFVFTRCIHRVGRSAGGNYDFFSPDGFCFVNHNFFFCQIYRSYIYGHFEIDTGLFGLFAHVVSQHKSRLRLHVARIVGNLMRNAHVSARQCRVNQYGFEFGLTEIHTGCKTGRTAAQNCHIVFRNGLFLTRFDFSCFLRTNHFVQSFLNFRLFDPAADGIQYLITIVEKQKGRRGTYTKFCGQFTVTLTENFQKFNFFAVKLGHGFEFWCQCFTRRTLC